MLRLWDRKNSLSMGYAEGWNHFKSRVDKLCEESIELRAECKRTFAQQKIAEWWQIGDMYLSCVTLQGEIFFLAFLCTYCYSTLVLCPQNHYLLPSLSKTKQSPCLIGKCTHGKGIRNQGMWCGIFWPCVMVRAPSNNLWSLHQTLLYLRLALSATKNSCV